MFIGLSDHVTFIYESTKAHVFMHFFHLVPTFPHYIIVEKGPLECPVSFQATSKIGHGLVLRLVPSQIKVHKL